MTFDLALNRLDHDMVFQPVLNGKYSIWPIDGADKVAQQIKITLLAFLGEWFLDTTFGVPYLEDILIKNPRMSSVETILRSHISDVPDVSSIDSFTMDWNRKSRVLSVQYACSTALGPIQDSLTLEVFRNV